MLVAIPSAVKVFNWTATLYKGSISWETPMLYALGFIGLFTIGGLTGVILATLGIDLHVHDTYFIIAHFHYIMVGGAIMGYMGGLHYWWPKITGKLYSKFWSKVVGAHRLRRLQRHVLPAVHPRLPRHAAPLPRVPARVPGAQRACRRRAPRCSASATCCRLIYFIWSMRYGKDASANPWGAVGLEWETRSPPPTENFDDAAGRDVGRLRLRARSRHGGASHRASPPTRAMAAVPRTRSRRDLAHHFDSIEQQRKRRRSACGCSWSPRSCSSAGSSPPTSSTAPSTPRRSSREQPPARRHLGTINTAS